MTAGSKSTLRSGEVRLSCVLPKAPRWDSSALAGCETTRGVWPAFCMLSKRRRPVAEPVLLRPVFVLPVFVRPVRGVAIVSGLGSNGGPEAEGCVGAKLPVPERLETKALI